MLPVGQLWVVQNEMENLSAQCKHEAGLGTPEWSVLHHGKEPIGIVCLYVLWT